MAVLNATQGLTQGSSKDLIVRFTITTAIASGIEKVLNEVDNDEEDDQQIGRDHIDKKLATMLAEKITGFDPSAFQDKVK
jgi:hypothetical protein